MKYTTRLVGSVLIGCIFILSPVYYFFSQNFDIFMSLAYDHSPELIEHLERERFWIQSSFAGGFIAMLSFTLVVGYRMTSKIVGPIKVVRNHLRRLNLGDWKVGKVHIRANDEFQDFVDTFNYFYLTYQHKIEKDINDLKQMNLKPENGEAYYVWKNLIAEKEKQLSIEPEAPLFILNGKDPIISSGEDASASPDSRHVS